MKQNKTTITNCFVPKNMNKLIILTSILFVFIGQLRAQNDCEGLDESNNFTLACLDNLNSCTAGVAPCDDATFDMIFGPGDWGFFACGNTIPSGCDVYQDYQALPVELISFGVRIRDKGIYLNWVTASEINNEGFYLEVSKDGMDWEQLVFVKGNGTTESENDYNFMHTTPMLGANYFRLKQMDFDGNHEYSKIKVALWRGGIEKLELVVVPNPTTEYIVPVLPFEYKDIETIDYEIYNEMGVLVKSFPATGKYDIKLSLYDLAPGHYSLVSRAKAYIHSARFVKI